MKIKIGEQVLEDTAAMLFQPGAADKIQLSTEKTTIKPGQTAIIRAEVTDQYDNPVKKVEVVFATTLGQVGAATAGDSGAYSAIFTAPAKEGTAIITAKVGEKSGTLSLVVSSKPAITITPASASLAKGESLQFQASEEVIWAVKGEIGSIDTKGNFKAEQEGSGVSSAVGAVFVVGGLLG